MLCEVLNGFFPLYKGVSRDLCEVLGILDNLSHFLENIMILLSRYSKIGGTFIGMPSKGRSDALHECKGCLVRQ